VSVNTAERIVQASLQLFNDVGPATVSTGRIASELGISAGNLYYHFKTKEQLIAVLLKRFEARLAPMQAGLRAVEAVDDLWLALHLTFEVIHDYRFIFRDADHLMNTSPGAAKALQRITANTLSATVALCASLAKSGILKANAEEQRGIALQIVFTATCWFVFAKMAPGDGRDPSDNGRAAYHVLSLLMPYLATDSRHYLLYLRSKYES
jgi:AcrR family transcriptional regulator